VVQSSIELAEHQGSALRGAFFHALRNRFCGNRQAIECAACPLVPTCPVAFLVSTFDPQSSRGRDVPRPFTVQPPLAAGEVPSAWAEARGQSVLYRQGEALEFGLTLYARALQFFPYIVLAANDFERNGIGRRVPRPDGQWRRGTLTIREVWAENPLTGERQAVLRTGENIVHVPDLPITHDQVCLWAERLERHTRLTLHFLTPTRLIEAGRLVKPQDFRFQPFFQRLMERLEALSRQFSATPLAFDNPRGIIAAASEVRVVENQLIWEELRSYSTRRQTASPLSGLMRHAVLEAEDWRPFLPWLGWGRFTHVGKDAVKGNGLYEITPTSATGASASAHHGDLASTVFRSSGFGLAP